MLKVVGASWEKTRLTTIMLGTVIVIAIFTIFFLEVPLDINDGNYAATVYWSENSGYSYKFWGQGNDPDAINHGVARAYYRPDMNANGWATIEIQTQPHYPDWVQAHAAGLVEGSLCWQLIFWHWQNTVAYNCESHREFCEEARTYLTDNSDKIRRLALKNDKTDPLWHQVNLFYAQLDGLEIGWRYGVTKSRKQKEIDIPQIDFLWMNAVADLRDLALKYNLTKSMDPGKLPMAITLLKLLPESKNFTKFLLAHASGGYYNEMLRVQKKYNFGFHITYDNVSTLVPGQKIQFTSYPAAIHSQDDFYHVSGKNKFIISSTSIKNFNSSLWDNLDNEKLLMGPRVMAANRLARNGSEWGRILGSCNGGTGMKQWLILQPTPRDARAWVVEQIPGKTITEDQTNVLKEKGYLTLYGLHHYEELKTLTGMKNAGDDVKKFYVKVQNLLDKGQENVTDKDSLIDFMRSPEMTIVGRSDIRESDSLFLYDQYIDILPRDTNRSFSQEAGHKNVKISQSGEINHLNDTGSFLTNSELLNASNLMEINNTTTENADKRSPSHIRLGKGGILQKELNGNIDLKVIGEEGSFQAAAGPPYTDCDSTPQIEPFQWSKTVFRDVPHYGHVDVWKFDPIEPQWVWN